MYMCRRQFEWGKGGHSRSFCLLALNGNKKGSGTYFGTLCPSNFYMKVSCYYSIIKKKSSFIVMDPNKYFTPSSIIDSNFISFWYQWIIKAVVWVTLTTDNSIIVLIIFSILTLLVSWVSIMKLCTCFSARLSSSLRDTTATRSAVQPAPCKQVLGSSRRWWVGEKRDRRWDPLFTSVPSAALSLSSGGLAGHRNSLLQ